MRSLVPHSTANLGADIRTLLTANSSSNSGLGVSRLSTALSCGLNVSLCPHCLESFSPRQLGSVEPTIPQSVLVQVVYRPGRRRSTIASLIPHRIRSQWLEAIRIVSIPVVATIVHPIVA